MGLKRNEQVLLDDYENWPLILKNGWNWIGYLPQKSNTVDSALATIRPNGDFMKNQTSFTDYYEGIGWYSSNGLVNMSPGIGYKLYIIADDTLVYTNPPETIAKQAGYREYPSDIPWRVKTRAFENGMAVTGVLKRGERECMSDELIVGAFVGDDCRGLAGVAHHALE